MVGRYGDGIVPPAETEATCICKVSLQIVVCVMSVKYEAVFVREVKSMIVSLARLSSKTRV